MKRAYHPTPTANLLNSNNLSGTIQRVLVFNSLITPMGDFRYNSLCYAMCYDHNFVIEWCYVYHLLMFCIYLVNTRLLQETISSPKTLPHEEEQ